MSKPILRSWTRLKRLARYLLVNTQTIFRYSANGGESPSHIDVYSDFDWAGCARTKRSTSGGAMMLAGGLVKSWSSTQATVATSSGEAEYYALTRAAAEGLGVQALMLDLGWSVGLRVWVDSTAAKAIGSRVALGKVRHMEVK